ncbi:MAG: hypothetical protein QXK07_07925 [Desulfurococcaceae archaeon]
MRAQSEAVAVLVVAIMVLWFTVVAIGVRARLLSSYILRFDKSLNVYARETNSGVCLSASSTVRAVLVKYNSTYADVVGSTVLRPGSWYCVSARYSVAAVTPAGVFVVEGGRVTRR